MATIKEVAKLAGVSVATISRVLNNSGYVSPDTAAKVYKAIEQLDYQPNSSSRSLRISRSGMILVLLPEFANPFWGNILEGMDERAQHFNHKLLIVPTHSSRDKELSALTILKQRQADGAILLSPVVEEEKLLELDSDFPIVQCCEYAENSVLPHVSINNYAAAYQATAYLVSAGYKKLAMVSSTNKSVSTKQREAGFKKALSDNNISISSSMLLRGSYTYESGYEQTKKLLAGDSLPTAILAISDTVAAGCLFAIQEAGLKCPEDIALIGFDNISLTRMINPKLSTVSQPMRLLGETAVDMLFDRMNGSKECRQIFLPHELVIRQST